MDVIHALDLLTEDCWREVFKKAWGPADLKSCSEVCTTFEGILFEKRNVWMFPAILPHILPYFRHALPDIYLRIWSPLYNCRLICKGWCQSIDHYLETYNNRFLGNHGPTHWKYSFEFGMPFGNFADRFETHGRNPFIGRYIRIDNVAMLTPPQLERDGYWLTTYIENVLRILGRFGSEIRSINVHHNPWTSNHLTFCKNIPILLGMLPNLKSLQFTNWNRHPLYMSIAQLEHIYEQEGLDQLPAFLAANPLPDNPNLRHLAMGAISTRMARPLLETYAPQLTRLELCDPAAFAGTAQRFRSLKELEIWSFDPQDSLPSLRQLQSPLETLHIHVKFNRQHRTWPIDELIRNIQHLPVTELHISNRAHLERKLDAFPAPLQHATIRRVTITSYTGSRLSCNFLRCFPNLEEVHFKYPHGQFPQPSGHDENPLIVSNDKEQMYELPIWDILPRLQIITVRKSSGQRLKYRRSTFEMRRFEKSKEILAVLF